MKVAFSGYYGMKNFGDDLFVAACDAGKHFWPTLSQGTYVAPAVSGVSAIYLCPVPLSPWFSRNDMAGAAIRLMTQLRGRLASDLFVFGGGSLFKGISRSRRIGSALGNLTGGREAAIGVSIGPFENASDERAVVQCLKRFEYISVRDAASERWLLSQNIDVPFASCGDLVGSCSFDLREARSRKRKVLGVSLAQSCRFELGDGSVLGNYYWALVRAIKSAAMEAECDVEVFDLNGNEQGGDGRLTHLLDWELRECGITPTIWSRRELSSWALAQKIGGCDAILSGRLHGAIVAYLQGIPFALVEYEEKCAEFLDDIGQSECRRLPFPDASVDDLQTTILNLFATEQDPLRRPDDYRQRSLGHFTYAPWAKNRHTAP